MTLQHSVDTPPAELLRSARELAWGEDESAAADAYDCAIRAIEQAFRQIATPDNPTDDLGVILAHWEERPDLWCEGYSRVHVLEPTMAALDSLWKQRPQADDRLPGHAGRRPRRRNDCRGRVEPRRAGPNRTARRTDPGGRSGRPAHGREALEGVSERPMETRIHSRNKSRSGGARRAE